jgi:hypothetical protein
MNGNPWTQEEKKFLEKKFARYGYKWCAKQLSRDPAIVSAKASRMGLRYGDIPGYVRAREAATLTGFSYTNIIVKADAAKASLRLGKRRVFRNDAASLVLVKEKWLAVFIDQLNKKDEGEACRASGFLTTRQCEQLWQLGKGTVRRGFMGVGFLAKKLEGAKVVRGYGGVGEGAYLINPHDAERIRKELVAERELAKTLIPTKRLAVEHGVKQSYAANIGKQLGGRTLLYRGRLCTMLSKEQAQLFRERVLLDYALPHDHVPLQTLAKQLGLTKSGIHTWFRHPSRKVHLRLFRESRSHVPAYCVPQWLAEEYKQHLTQS